MGLVFHRTVVNLFPLYYIRTVFSPPLSQALSILMINSYMEMRHGVNYVSPVTGLVLSFTVVLYVANTDLLL